MVKLRQAGYCNLKLLLLFLVLYGHWIEPQAQALEQYRSVQDNFGDIRNMTLEQ